MRAVIILVFITLTWGKPTGEIKNPMINDDLFEGDLMGIDAESDRNAVPQASRRWPGGIIPYEIDDYLKNTYHTEIYLAMVHIMKNSCIRFVPRRPEHKNYVRIYSGKGCSSAWGFIGRGQQLLSLGVGCEFHSTIVHELMHAIGFEHEHNRSDRDDYLIIQWDNIEPQFYHNFMKLQPHRNRLLTEFDFDSIMLYGQYFYSKNGRKTMEAKDGRSWSDTDDKQGLSELDIKRLNLLYECKKQ